MTPRQRALYDFLARWINAKGYAPSFDEISIGCNIPSRSSIHRMLHAIEAEGHIRLEPGRKRNISIVKPNAVQLRPEVLTLTDNYARVHGISRETAVNEALRQWLGAA